MPQAIIDRLNHHSFFISLRAEHTTFGQLFSQATYGACSGQLGLAIRFWADAFARTKGEVIADYQRRMADQRQETCYSKYLDMMDSMESSDIPQLYSELPKQDGTELAHRLTCS